MRAPRIDLGGAAGLLRYRAVAALLVLVAGAALYGAADLSRPGARAAPRGGHSPVTAALLVCPGGDGGRTTVQTLPADRSRGAGQLTVQPAGTGLPLLSTTQAGHAWTHDDARAPAARTVIASGGLAAGLAAERTSYRAKGDDRGLAATRCAPPGTDLWFLGPGPAAADRVEVLLTNPDPAPAAVDLAALSDDGPLDTVEGRGTQVPGHGSKVIEIGRSPEGLGAVVAGARDMALSVRATTGRVAAAVRVRSGAGQGVDWLPLSPAPARSVLVPGVPSGGGARRLALAVPGEGDARVRVQVLTSAGAFAPQGQDELDAPGRTVTAVDLNGALLGKPAAIRLVADRPIIAGFDASAGGDVAYGSATPPIGADGAVVADTRYAASVLLTAPDGAAKVRIVPLGAPGAAQEVAVPAGRTVEKALGLSAGGAWIVPLPGSGPVHAARTMTEAKRLTVLPLFPAAVTTALPPAGDTGRTLVR
ncbi:DUF5719 family protein [Actinomadura parmotrematis]|uniref:Secreted protein n=1 Tax=Actinomadura parmotrematis TaxID=2864039 RepID=A0ABS7FYT7_9ACTN|nr:DUF5719 family protein [Actinomadura parmotrematis]MBW8484598.1 hypothetical protein [Actinomadura parmotrematis]